MTRRVALACLLVSSSASADGTATSGAAAGAAAVAPAPAVVAQVPAPTEVAEPKGLAIGAELGDPISATVASFMGKAVVSAALGTATVESLGWSFHADAQMAVTKLAPKVPLRLGLGLRYYRHSHLASADEVASSHYGVRASIAVALERGSMELYFEVAPGVDFLRSASCTLMSGANSICPHAQESPLFLQAAVGARWFLSH